MRILLLSVLAALTGAACAVEAQDPMPPIVHTARVWNPATYEVVRLAPADLDLDQRDDVLMLLSDGSVVRAVNPGSALGFVAASEFSGIVDLATVRVPDSIDIVATVSATEGLRVWGMRPEGVFLSPPPNPVLWTDVSELRVFYDNGPVLAGRIGSSNKVRVARLDLTTYGFTDLGFVTFADDLLDFGLDRRTEDPEVHVVGLTESGLARRFLDNSLMFHSPYSATEGYISALQGSTFVAWVRRPGPTSNWELVLERNGLQSVPLVLDYDAYTFGDLEVDGLSSADFDEDGLDDLVIGHNSSGDVAVLFGASTGYALNQTAFIEAIGPDVSAAQPGVSKSPATAAGQPDGDRTGLFHVAGTYPALDVVDGINNPLAPRFVGDGLEEWLPDLDPNFMATLHGGTGDLVCELNLPQNLRDFAEAENHYDLHIAVWRAEDLVDPSTNQITLSQASIAPGMANNYFWHLDRDASTGRIRERHQIRLALDLGTQTSASDWEHDHALLLVRIGTIDQQPGEPPILTGAVFTTPMWMAMDDFGSGGIDPSGFIEQTSSEFFDDDIDSTPVQPTGGAKDISRIRPGQPIFPGLPGSPTPVPITPRGTTNDSQ